MYTLAKTKENIEVLHKNFWTPDENLTQVPYVKFTNEEDLKKVPKKNGAYWIVTNEPIKHSMFINKQFPAKIDDYEIIYNGVASNLQERAKNHLLRTECWGYSAISVDLYMGNKPPKSHVKVAYTANNKKVPYIDGARVSTISDLQKMTLSVEEMNWLSQQSDKNDILFWNGINVFWTKHKPFEWRFYYLEEERVITDIIEKKWRQRYGKPRLCSYNEGR